MSDQAKGIASGIQFMNMALNELGALSEMQISRDEPHALSLLKLLSLQCWKAFLKLKTEQPSTYLHTSNSAS